MKIKRKSSTEDLWLQIAITHLREVRILMAGTPRPKRADREKVFRLLAGVQATCEILKLGVR